MLQELAAQTGAATWAIGSMLFFVAAWVAVVVWIIRKRPEDLERQARLPLDDGDGRIQESGAGIQEESGDGNQGGGTAPTPES